MTNTPMTSREAFALHCVEQKPKGYWVSEGDFEAGWQASQAQQEAVIAELLEVLQNIADEYLITGLYSQAEVKRDIYGDILILDHEKPVINIVEKLDNVIEKHKKGTT